MTRTGASPRLSGHTPEPFVEINPGEAEARGIAAGMLVEVRSRFGRILGRAQIADSQRAGTIFVPMHWTDQYASAGRVDALVEANTDPHSGQPALKSTMVEVRAFAAAWYGFAVLRDRPGAVAADYWALARSVDGWRLELAGTAVPADWTTWAQRLVPAVGKADLIAYHDAAGDRHRFAAFDGDRLVGAIFVSRDPLTLGRTVVAESLSAMHAGPGDRLRVLAGRASVDRPDPGAIVCSCFAVGVNQIVAAVVNGGCTSVAAIGENLKAGTNCGCCRPEIRRIVDEHAVQEAV